MMDDGAGTDTEDRAAESERLSDQSWEWHRKQQLQRLNIDVEDLDA